MVYRPQYRYGYVLIRVQGGELQFPTVPAGYFCIHTIIVGNWQLAICGVAIDRRDNAAWVAAHQANDVRYLGDTLSEARTELKNIWSQVQGKVHVEFEAGQNFKRFGYFCGQGL